MCQIGRCYLAIHFPIDDPPGWAWGKPLTSSRGTGKNKLWVNFTATGEPYDETDDSKVECASLTAELYKKDWAVVAPKDFEVMVQAAQVRIPR